MLAFRRRIPEHEYLLTNLDIIRAPDWEELELEDEHGNSLFRSLPSHHAPTFLAEYVNKLRSLEIIPGGQESYGCFYDEHGGKMVRNPSLFLERPFLLIRICAVPNYQKGPTGAVWLAV